MLRGVFRLLAFCVLFVSLVGGCFAQLADTPWPCMHQNLQRTGQSPYSRFDVPTFGWTYQAADKMLGSPIVGLDNTLYFTTPMFLYALDLNGGQFKWSYQLLTDADAGPVQGQDGMIYLSASNGEIYAINSEGGLEWSDNPSANSSFTPTVAPDGSIYFGTERYLLAMNPDGSLKWHFSGSTGQYSRFEAAPAIAPDGTIYCPCVVDGWQTALIALSPEKEVLHGPFRTANAKQITPAIASNGDVFFAVGAYIYALSYDLSEKWRMNVMGSIGSTPSLTSRGTVVIVSSDHFVYAVAQHGPVGRWMHDSGASLQASAVSDVNGYVYTVGALGEIQSFTPNGDMVWRYKIGEAIASQMAMGQEGQIYVGLVDGRVLCLNSRDSGNNPPQLSGGSVWPPMGDPSTEFHYTVKYYDPDGEAPLAVLCWVDDLAMDMTLSDGTADNGTYEFTANLVSEVDHNYYFSATDARGAWVRYPTDVETFQGPEVREGALLYPEIFLVMEKDSFRAGETLNLYAYARNESDQPVFVDIYLAFQWYDGEQLLFLPSLSPEPRPFASRLLLLANEETDMYQIFSDTVPDLPDANYAWVGAMTPYDSTSPLYSLKRKYWRVTK